LPDPADDWEEAAAKDGPHIWSSVVSDLAALRDPQAHRLIGQLFDNGWIDLFFIDRDYCEELYKSTDPLYGVNPEPRELLISHGAMQERWKSSEAGQTTVEHPTRPSGRDKRRARKQARKSQKQARRKQRSKCKKKR
jgi:hypothetical protein